ncbi:hypothetical protein GIB67_030425 [Kingdonia uniflora]|uniref:Chalcone/stilbene synthase N-terminal domain-containing protein n=1 Tax=Kingdonia uniflora TaxID=39325 RepID=A0A7J7NDS9_9MAGN|nr:hypothetical protein GIB67_030425 [Kingdonia uniflora]
MESSAEESHVKCCNIPGKLHTPARSKLSAGKSKLPRASFIKFKQDTSLNAANLEAVRRSRNTPKNRKHEAGTGSRVVSYTGPTTVLAIGTTTPSNCVCQADYPDYYFRITKSEYLVDLKEKFKRMCDKSMIKKRYMHLDEEILKQNWSRRILYVFEELSMSFERVGVSFERVDMFPGILAQCHISFERVVTSSRIWPRGIFSFERVWVRSNELSNDYRNSSSSLRALNTF